MTNRNKLEEPEEKSRIRSVCYTNDTVLTELEEKKKLCLRKELEAWIRKL